MCATHHMTYAVCAQLPWQQGALVKLSCTWTHIHSVPMSDQDCCLQCAAGDHKSDLVTRLNPRGQLPVYEEGDIVIPDSLASIIWIEEQHGKSGTPLLPPVSDRKHRALVRLVNQGDAMLWTAS